MTEKQAEFIPADKDLEKFNGRAVPAVIEPNGFLSVIERLSKMPDIPVEKIQQLMDMQEKALDRSAKQEFNAAMMRAQSKIELVVAKEENKQTGSNYANLKGILIKTKPVYTAEGFSLMFYEGESPKETQKRVCVDIMHSGGHTEKRYGDFTIQTTGIAGKAMMTQIHGEGSAFSYGRRYLTCMVFNIPTGDDDDGNAAGGKVAEFIDDKQLSQIIDMINSKGVDSDLFLDYMKVGHPENIKASDFGKAMNALKKAKGKERDPGSDDN